MWVKKITIQNIRGFTTQKAVLDFSKSINLLVGPNNSGKSTIIKCMSVLQFHSLSAKDITKNNTEAEVVIHLEEMDVKKISMSDSKSINTQDYGPEIIYKVNTSNMELSINSKNGAVPQKLNQIPSLYPNNFIYPFFAKRKPTGYAQEMNISALNAVSDDLSALYLKIDALSVHTHPGHQDYLKYCEDILGLKNIGTIPIEKGKSAGFIMSNGDHIPITSMGDGIPHLLGFIVDLCAAKNNLFLIEEPENDIHPKALRALLELIKKKSETNQFVISTHSNIVVKELAAHVKPPYGHTKIFRVDSNLAASHLRLPFPVSKVEEIPNTKEARRELLAELGYEFDDLDLWKAWLFFEESSMEWFVREYFIPWFVPELLGKLRTYSAKTVTQIKLSFQNFNSLFVFLHLESVYKDKVWVIIDGGDNEKQILDDLKRIYVEGQGWKADRFQQLSEHDFEQYYPQRFQERVVEVLSIVAPDKKRTEKANLLDEVKRWVQEYPTEAKTEFEQSTKEIIDKLKKIAIEIK